MSKIIVSILLFLNPPCFAEICGSNGTKVYFGNGVLNTASTATESEKALIKMDFSVVDEKSRISFNLAENFDETGFLSVLTAIAQRSYQKNDRAI